MIIIIPYRIFMNLLSISYIRTGLYLYVILYLYLRKKLHIFYHIPPSPYNLHIYYQELPIYYTLKKVIINPLPLFRIIYTLTITLPYISPLPLILPSYHSNISMSGHGWKNPWKEDDSIPAECQLTGHAECIFEKEDDSI